MQAYDLFRFLRSISLNPTSVRRLSYASTCRFVAPASAGACCETFLCLQALELVVTRPVNVGPSVQSLPTARQMWATTRRLSARRPCQIGLRTTTGRHVSSTKTRMCTVTPQKQIDVSSAGCILFFECLKLYKVFRYQR